jgi:putative hydrolase of the HAD superfamily
MTSAVSLTTLFLDLGNVLLTDSWSAALRQRAVEAFAFDVTEVAKRSQLAFEAYELGKLSLDDFLDIVVFYRPQSFSRTKLKEFMLAQSQAYPDMLVLIRELKARYGLKIIVVNNDGREFIEDRIQRFGLAEFVDSFVVSCFVHYRKPDPDIYRLALDISYTRPEQALYIDDQALFVEAARRLGIRSICHTSYSSTRAALALLGLSLDQPSQRDVAA